MSLLTAFNNLLEQFLDELVRTFPELTDLATMQTLVGLLRKMNPRKVQENFFAVAGRYHKRIFARDEKFFIDLENWKDDPELQTRMQEEQLNQEELFGKFAVFAGVWGDLSDNNKDHIWTYMTQLLVLGAKSNKSPSLQPLSEMVIQSAKELRRK